MALLGNNGPDRTHAAPEVWRTKWRVPGLEGIPGGGAGHSGCTPAWGHETSGEVVTSAINVTTLFGI